MTKSARERLIRALNDDACTCGGSACPTAEQLVDAYAHELAEQIRAWADDPMADNSRADAYGDVSNVFNAANLIDPEAQP